MFQDMDTFSSHKGRKNRRKNIPMKASMLNPPQLKFEAFSVENIVENMRESKSTTFNSDTEMACNNPEPIDLSISPISHHSHQTTHMQKAKRPSTLFSLSPVAEHVRHPTQLGMHFPLYTSSSQMSWLNMLKSERRDEWQSTLQRSLSHINAAHCKLSETLHLLKKDLPVDMTTAQHVVQKLLVELGSDVQRLAQFQHAIESISPPATAIQSQQTQQDNLIQFYSQKVHQASVKNPPGSAILNLDLQTTTGVVFPEAISDHNSHQDKSPPLKKAKKDPRCQDDEEANYVDPLWKPITFLNDGVLHVNLSAESDVNLPMSKFEELLKKASCSSTRLLRVLMKHFFTHEQLAAGSLTGEGFYKNKLDESITRAIREIVSQRHPKLKKAKINLCCTDVCVQARRVNENQKRRISRVPFESIPFSQQQQQQAITTSNPSDDNATSPDEHCASFDHLSDSPSPGALSLNLSMPDMTTIDPLDVDN